MTTTSPMPAAADSLPDASPAASASAASAASSAFDAFISYKRTDIAFARALEKALNAFTPPKGLVDVPQRRLRVFRDEGDVDARRRLLEQLRAGARFSRFEELQAVGIRP